MAEFQNLDVKVRNDTSTSQINPVAAQTALAIVPDARCDLDPELLAKLRNAALGLDQGAISQVVTDALKDGVRREDLADSYIPALARDMGEQWFADQLGFASVTIGASRLQALLRDLGPAWSGDCSAAADAPSILLIVPQDEHHTLGAMVMSGQLRRKGYSVCLLLGRQCSEIAERMQHVQFQSVFISVSHPATLETLRRIVNVVKRATAHQPPVVIGGQILAFESEDYLIEFTGADYAADKPERALRLCGLKAKSQGSISMMRRA